MASAALSTTSAVNNITNLLGSAIASQASNSPPPSSNSVNKTSSLPASQSPQHLFSQNETINNSSNSTNLTKNNSLLNTNANNSSEAGTGSPVLQQTAQVSTGLQTSTTPLATMNSSSSIINHCIPPSLTSSTNNAHQTALLNELFANGNIINLSTSLNLIQQLSQPAYVAISTNPLILLPINSALANSNNLTSNNSSTTTTTTTSSSSNKLTPSSSSQDVAEQSTVQQLINNHLNGLLNQAVLESLNKGNNDTLINLLTNQQSNQTNSLKLNSSSINSSPINPSNNVTKTQRTGDEPMDLSAKRKCTSSRLNSIVSLLEQQESFANNTQLLKNISIDALNALQNSQSDVASAFLLPKSLNSLTTQQQLQQLLLKQQPRIYSCSNCQIDFHKQENYAVHKKYYCSATKQLLLEANSLNAQKQSLTDDLETFNHLLNSEPNSPQSNQSQPQTVTTTANRTSAASNNTINLIDTFNQVTKKISTSSSGLANSNNAKTSGCVSPNILSNNNSPVGSPSSSFNHLTNNTAIASSSTTPTQPIYKHFCSKCGIRFTSKDNLHAHQTYYCGNNSTNLNGTGIPSTITNFNSASGLTEVNCPKCKF